MVFLHYGYKASVPTPMRSLYGYNASVLAPLWLNGYEASVLAASLLSTDIRPPCWPR